MTLCTRPIVAGAGPNRLPKAPRGRYWWYWAEFLLVTAATNRVTAFSLRGLRTTAKVSAAVVATGPSARSVIGMRGSEPMATIRTTWWPDKAAVVAAAAGSEGAAANNGATISKLATDGTTRSMKRREYECRS